jgi:hypothetical protein
MGAADGLARRGFQDRGGKLVHVSVFGFGPGHFAMLPLWQ